MGIGQILANYWWVIFPVGGVVGGGLRRFAVYNERRREYKIEMARIKAGAAGEQARISQAATNDVSRALRLHDAVDARWFNYELDLATIITYPMMVDLREDLTMAFHRAKAHADALRPADANGLSDIGRFNEYRDAVTEYSVAFDAAEREARRRKQSGFSPAERDRLERARKLVMIAVDDAATPAERQVAYRKARAELDGLIDVPKAAAEQLESSIAGELEG